MKANVERIIIIDDDYCHNSLAVFAIRKLLQAFKVHIIAFTNPEEALSFIETDYMKNPVMTILFLDIYMRRFSGWEVVTIMERMPKNILQHFMVYMLTNSTNPEDIETAKQFTLVNGYLLKPISDHFKDILKTIVPEVKPDSFSPFLYSTGTNIIQKP